MTTKHYWGVPWAMVEGLIGVRIMSIHVLAWEKCEREKASMQFYVVESWEFKHAFVIAYNKGNNLAKGKKEINNFCFLFSIVVYKILQQQQLKNTKINKPFIKCVTKVSY